MEAWQGEELVGGQYGVSIGGAWFGESMFHTVDDSSKVCMVVLSRWLSARGCSLFDAQVYTDNVARFGAEAWSRATYLERLTEVVAQPSLTGPWTLDPEDPALDLSAPVTLVKAPSRASGFPG